MPHHVTVIESTSLDFPAALCDGALERFYPRIWAIGNLAVLKTRLTGFFCSTKCPGNVIVHIYDLARAMRDSGVSIISGFHSPMEKESLDLLLRGTQPVVLCPARNIEQMRFPTAWRTPIAEGRLLILSPFDASHYRATAKLSEQRNCFVGALADTIVLAHAHAGSKIDRLYTWIMASDKRVFTLNLPENASLIQHGVPGYTVPELVDCLLGQQGRLTRSTGVRIDPRAPHASPTQSHVPQLALDTQPPDVPQCGHDAGYASPLIDGHRPSVETAAGGIGSSPPSCRPAIARCH